ncbi:MAG: type II secretion system protein M [Pseudomonadota bacterium]
MEFAASISRTFRASGLGRWYFGREPYEQKIVSLIAFAVVLLLLWAYVWKPVADWRDEAQNRQNLAQQTLDWLNANERAIQAAARNRNSANQGARALIPIINRTAKSHDLALNSLTPDSNGVVGVMLRAQSFNEILNWVAQLEENNGVYVQRASFDEQGAPGYVNAQIRLN